MDVLQDLAVWYLAQCNGLGTRRIDTLDNPGWIVTIDLKGTQLGDRKKISELSSGLGGTANWSRQTGFRAV
jgi:hypothetical protein